MNCHQKYTWFTMELVVIVFVLLRVFWYRPPFMTIRVGILPNDALIHPKNTIKIHAVCDWINVCKFQIHSSGRTMSWPLSFYPSQFHVAFFIYIYFCHPFLMAVAIEFAHFLSIYSMHYRSTFIRMENDCNTFNIVTQIILIIFPFGSVRPNERKIASTREYK